MHSRLQFGMRENPASSRRHGSRQTANSPSTVNRVNQGNLMLGEPSPSQNQFSPGVGSSASAAAPHAATGGERNAAATPNAVVGPLSPAKTLRSFEPLIGSCEAAKLLGNIHVKTLQRYARHRRVPGYQIGGHWYFRASELDSWLQSRINLSCHPCRLQEKSDGT
jgi:excisionase family DNA binding protein